MSVDKETERRRLFEEGGMTLVRTPSGGRMVATSYGDPAAQRRARTYNVLAGNDPDAVIDFIAEQLRGKTGDARRDAYERMVQERAI